jgi:hypothetical protein
VEAISSCTVLYRLRGDRMGSAATMITRMLEQARSNAVAYLALGLSILALAGGAYAAWVVPPHSVGARQIINHSIAPIKLDPSAIGGSVRHWAGVDAQGSIVSSSSRAHDTGVPIDGDYLINWSDTFSNRCVPVVTVLGPAALLSPASGFANARLTGSHPTRVWVSTYKPQGGSNPESFSVAVVC